MDLLCLQGPTGFYTRKYIMRLKIIYKNKMNGMLANIDSLKIG